MKGQIIPEGGRSQPRALIGVGPGLSGLRRIPVPRTRVNKSASPRCVLHGWRGTGWPSLALEKKRTRTTWTPALRFSAVTVLLRQLCLSLRRHAALCAVGLMFWLRRKRFVGSYLSLRATSRS